jgi:hypothetical protein
MNMKRLVKKFEDVMTASVFAEAGESGTAREILNEGRRILLAINEGHSDKKTLKYALNICKRVVANLDILYTSSTDEMDPELKEFFGELERERIDYNLVRREGCLEKEIKEYTDSHEEILFVIIDSSEGLDVDSGSIGKLSEVWRNLKCPLVVVEGSIHA